MIGIVMTFLENKFSFKLDLYFTRYMHANTKNKMWAPMKNFIFDFFILFFYFLIKFEIVHQNKILDGYSSTLEIFLLRHMHISVLVN